jgi:hypothetical protein
MLADLRCKLVYGLGCDRAVAARDRRSRVCVHRAPRVLAIGLQAGDARDFADRPRRHHRSSLRRTFASIRDRRRMRIYRRSCFQKRRKGCRRVARTGRRSRTVATTLASLRTFTVLAPLLIETAVEEIWTGVEETWRFFYDPMLSGISPARELAMKVYLAIGAQGGREQTK